MYVMMIHSFLACSQPVRAEVLVVEGWIGNRPALREAAQEFQNGGYNSLVCVGSASSVRTAERLVELGVDKEQVQSVTVPEGEAHRTFRSAVAVRDWLRKQTPVPTTLNVFTLGVHARKSHVLFKKAFGPGYQIGIIAGTEYAYPVRFWWTSRAGIYLVLRNTAGYLYALLWPSQARAGTGEVSRSP